MRKFVLSAKEFNKAQDERYAGYKSTCEMHGTKVEPQERYFMKCPVNYGFVYINASGETITWKKRKKDFPE